MNLDQMNRNDAINVWRKLAKLNEAIRSEGYTQLEYSKKEEDLKKKPKNQSPSIILALIAVGILMFLVYCFLGEGGIVNVLGAPTFPIIFTVIGITVGIQVIRKIIYYKGGAHEKYRENLDKSLETQRQLSYSNERRLQALKEEKEKICKQYSIPLYLSSADAVRFILNKVTNENTTFAYAIQAYDDYEKWAEQQRYEDMRRKESEARHREEMKKLSEIKDSLDRIDRYNRTGY